MGITKNQRQQILRPGLLNGIHQGSGIGWWVGREPETMMKGRRYSNGGCCVETLLLTVLPIMVLYINIKTKFKIYFHFIMFLILSTVKSRMILSLEILDIIYWKF